MVDGPVRRRRYAVLVVTYGEVEKLTLRNLWPSSRRILKVITSQIVKVPRFLVYLVADYRSTKHFIDWRRSGYRSTLLATNRAQRARLEACLRSRTAELPPDTDIDVLDAYYFVPPYLEEMLGEIRSRYDGIVVVPMIPVESAFSCGVACRMVSETYGDERYSRVRLMNRFWSDEALHRIYADHLFSRIAESPLADTEGKLGLVLVIHGTLVRDRAGNPPKVFTGLDETGRFFEMMKRRIMEDPRNIFADIRQGCMNHSAGGEWTADTVEKALEAFRREGCRGVVMFPYGFFADNSETEYEAKRLLESAGFPRSYYVRCINDSPAFADWLAGRVAGELCMLQHIQQAYESLEPKS
ncbi:ferrochelatase [Chlorobium sp. N1]|uniref:ferrochelatase n=1 Tax=Chlorobium sp. N1 TaxID=2491138 RepID=UPI00103A5697|nr:ferrochelatase [Chlorobium sp. N1]TCD47302.1 ferrochelatase [Chlorobium sp. N1]